MEAGVGGVCRSAFVENSTFLKVIPLGNTQPEVDGF